jgi:hypothetical protein
VRGVAGLLLLLVLVLAGCGSVAFGPAYTAEELGQFCLRRGGSWHADELRGGSCEFEAAGFM